MYHIKSFVAFLVLVLAILGYGCTAAEGPEGWEDLQLRTEYEDIKVTQIVSGLERPWSLAFLPDNRMLVTERPGRLNIIDNGIATEVNGIPEVRSVNQGGLLEVSVHPDYSENGWIYLTYSKAGPDEQTALTLVRGQLDGTDFVQMEEIFQQNRFSSPGRHYGSKIAWDNAGFMYVSIGDRGTDPPRAQDLSDHAGTLLRLNDDGSVPDDNPFVGVDGAANEIFSYGHRNIQGLIINQENNEIWATEHGPRGGDELNYVEAGKNYGWPTASLGRDYRDDRGFHDHTEVRTAEGMTDPVYEFLPTLAPSGLVLLTTGQFAQWRGNLLAGGLRAQRIRRVLVQDYTVIHDEELLTFEIGRIRDIREGPDGFIYVVTDENPGAVYRVEPN